MMNRLQRLLRQEAGFTLPELIVYMFLFAIVGTMVAMLVWNGYRTQIQVTQTKDRGSEIQSAAIALEYDVRFAAAFQVDPTGNLLITRTWIGDNATGSYVCRGWYYDDAENVLRRGYNDAQVAGADVNTAAGWDIYVAEVTGNQPFTANSRDSLSVLLTAKPETFGGFGTKVETTVTKRPQTESQGAPCF